MKKSVLLGGIAALTLGAIVGGYYMVRANGAPAKQESSAATTAPLTLSQQLGQPTRTAELKGVVKSIEGNDITLLNEISDETLTDEERAAKKAERQALSQEERQALKAEETATLETETAHIVIPVGAPMYKGSGDASGEVVPAQLSDIKAGTYISVWVKEYKTTNQQVEFVKVRTTTN